MTSPSPINSLTKARRRYTSARTILWNAHGALTRMNVDQGHLLALEQALIDNQASIDYLRDIARNLQTAAEATPFRQPRSTSRADP